jgi:hypothetical protein
VVARVVRERTEGKTAYAIARDLNKDAVPTAQGASAWSQSTVRALLTRAHTDHGHRGCLAAFGRSPGHTAAG